MNNNNDIYDMDKFASHEIIRSSKNKSAMIHWGNLRYEKKRNRWFESLSCDIYGDAKPFLVVLEAEFDEIGCFHKAHPGICSRESVTNVFYHVNDPDIKSMFVMITEYARGEEKNHTFEVPNPSAADRKAWEKAVHDWHATGVLRIGEYKYKTSA